MIPIAAGPAGITTVTVTPQAAADAYQRTDAGTVAGDTNSFGATLERMVGEAVAQGHEADQQATAAISGNGDITQVVTSLARAQLTLQSATAIRDRVVSAYQQIMQMPI